MSSRHSFLALVFLLAASTGAVADEQCSGTLCDWYYGKSSSFDDPPKSQKAPTPLTVPTVSGGGIMGRLFGSGSAQPAQPGAAAAATTPGRRPLVGVGGGGLAALARGEKTDRCTGTLCDLFYGGPPPEPEPVPAAPATTATSQLAPAEAPEVAPDDAQPGVRFVEHSEPPRCAATGKDPWGCYR